MTITRSALKSFEVNSSMENVRLDFLGPFSRRGAWNVISGRFRSLCLIYDCIQTNKQLLLVLRLIIKSKKLLYSRNCLFSWINRILTKILSFISYDIFSKVWSKNTLSTTGFQRIKKRKWSVHHLKLRLQIYLDGNE